MLLNKRQLIGFLISPPLAPIVYYVILSWPSPFNASSGNAFDAFLTTILIGAPISYVVAALLGVPVFVFLRKKGWLNMVSITLTAGVVAIVPGIFSEIVNGTIINYTLNKFIVDMEFLLCGFVVGIVFWFIAVRGDKTDISPITRIDEARRN